MTCAPMLGTTVPPCDRRHDCEGARSRGRNSAALRSAKRAEARAWRRQWL